MLPASANTPVGMSTSGRARFGHAIRTPGRHIRPFPIIRHRRARAAPRYAWTASRNVAAAYGSRQELCWAGPGGACMTARSGNSGGPHGMRARGECPRWPGPWWKLPSNRELDLASPTTEHSIRYARAATRETAWAAEASEGHTNNYPTIDDLNRRSGTRLGLSCMSDPGFQGSCDEMPRGRWEVRIATMPHNMVIRLSLACASGTYSSWIPRRSPGRDPAGH